MVNIDEREKKYVMITLHKSDAALLQITADKERRTKSSLVAVAISEYAKKYELDDDK